MQYLAQDLMLLAFDDKKGTFVLQDETLPYGLMGTVLMELVLQGKLDTKAGVLVVVNTTTTGDAFFDNCLNEIVTATRPRDASFWLNHLIHKFKGFKNFVLNKLIELGVLKQEEHRVFGLFPKKSYSLVDVRAKQALIDRIRAAVLNNAGLDSRTVAFISLIKACNLTNYLFTPDEQREAHQRIEKIVGGEMVGKAISDTVATVQAVRRAGVMSGILASATQ